MLDEELLEVKELREEAKKIMPSIKNSCTILMILHARYLQKI